MPTPITPADKFRLAQQLASQVAPMWAPVIKQWEPKPVWGSKKLTVKGREIKFDSLMPVEQLAAEIIHATDHFVMGHKGRKDERDKARWQTAACMETIKRWDKAIKDAGLEWAPGTDIREDHPEIKRNEAEKVYDELQEVEGDPQPGDGEEQGDLGDDDGDGDGEPQDGDGKPGKGKPGKGKPGKGQPGQGQPGDPADGQGQPQKGDPADGSGKGTPGEGDGVCRLEENDYDDSMLDELGEEGPGEDGDGDEDGEPGDGKPGDKSGKPPGKTTGDKDLERQKEQAFLSLARKIVNRLFSGADKRDYSLSKPSNRSALTNGGILSSLHKKPEEIGIIIDVSGSVDDKMRNAIFRVCEKVQRQLGTNGNILVALGDTEVKDVGPMRRVLDNAKGGGGTAMEKVIPDAARMMRHRTRYLIITDGETKWPDKLPPNSLVLLVNDNNPNTTKSFWYDIPPHVRRNMMWVTKKELMEGGVQRPKVAPARDLDI